MREPGQWNEWVSGEETEGGSLLGSENRVLKR